MKNQIFNPKEALKNFIASHNKYEKMENFNKNVGEIIQNIKSTNGKIAIISDFDYTLTRRFDLNNPLVNYYSTYCVIEKYEKMSEEFRKGSEELFNKYHKYETDISMDFETRRNLVLRWYMENFDLYLKEKIKKSDFEKIVENSHENFKFRNGILELFEVVLEYKIPFFIISGGLYDIIDHALKVVLPFYDRLKEENLIYIIANKFAFDESSGNITNVVEPVVYTFNKGEIIENYFERYKSSIENIILLGDHLNDTDSVKNLTLKNSIKIGFMNAKNLINSAEDYFLYDAFKQHFDIGIMNDGTLNFVNHILYDIFSHVKEEKLESITQI